MAVETEVVTPEAERAGRRSDHGSSADAWEQRERAANEIEISRALALLPPELQRRISDPHTVISPLVVAEQAKQMEAAFQALCKAVLTDDDYAWYEVTKQKATTLANGTTQVMQVKAYVQRKTKSSWRKLARYFNVDVDVTREVIGHRHNENKCSRLWLAKNGLKLEPDEDCGCDTVYARYHVKVIGANGRVGFGVGIASLNERGFKAQDHSIPATAYTRAVSRAISDMLAAGEGEAHDPAETVDNEEGTARPVTPPREDKPLNEAQAQEYGLAWTGSTDDRRKQAFRFLIESGYKKGEFTQRGAEDYTRVMEILGAPVPDSAP